MAAYAISEVEILDPDQARRYQELAAASIARYGGRYLVRDARPQVPEGDPPIEERVVLVEFPSMERLREWYASPEYAEALQIRQTALARRLLFVAGVDDARDEGAAGDEGEPGDLGGARGEGEADAL
jgi:uncharacterized protein (DUF1330 family)